MFIMKYAQTICDAIGNTPLIRLNKIVAGIDATILVKLEYMNPGGSVKDRLALQAIKDAESRGELHSGSTIIECTGSGNTGIGLAMIAAVQGYKTIFTMPDKNSQEKINLLRAYGAEVIICPTAVSPDDPRSYYKVAERLAKETSNAFFVQQYYNPSNPTAHYRSTGPEIWEQTKGKITHFVAGMGTGGTISGIGKYLKEQSPKVQIIGVDPVGSLYHEYFYSGAVRDAAKTYLIEGIGEDFLPETMDFAILDSVVRVRDKEAYQMSRRLAREEGILVGSSSGAAVAGAQKLAQKLRADDVMVILLPDSGRSYLSKVYNDEWMKEKELL